MSRIRFPYLGSIPQQVAPGIYGPLVNGNEVPFWDEPQVTLDLNQAQMSPWDVVSIGHIPLPGRCSVRTKKHKRIDIKKTKDSSPPTMTLIGYNPAEVDVTVAIWTPDQFRVLASMMEIILPKPRAGKVKLSDAVDIYHPSLFLLGIRSVIIEGVEALEPSTPKGLWTTKIKCLEWAPPIKNGKVSTPTGAESLTTAHVVTNTTGRLSQVPDPANTDTGINRPLRSGLHTSG